MQNTQRIVVASIKGGTGKTTSAVALAVMLAQESYAAHLGDCQFVIVDELHSFAGNKRGADLTLSLERLERLRGRDGALRRPRTPQRVKTGDMVEGCTETWWTHFLKVRKRGEGGCNGIWI